MFWFKLASLAVIGALIGYITNTIAVKMIFRPLNPICLPIINIQFQGLIPKRRQDIARTIGEIVDKELISIEALLDRFIENSGKEDLIEKVKEKIKEAVYANIPVLVPSVIKNMIIDYANEIIDKETEGFIMEAVEKLIDKASLHIKISEIVEEKINSFELEKLEELTMKIAKKELRHIEILGGVIGFFIGIIQGFIVLNIG